VRGGPRRKESRVVNPPSPLSLDDGPKGPVEEGVRLNKAFHVLKFGRQRWSD